MLIDIDGKFKVNVIMKLWNVILLRKMLHFYLMKFNYFLKISLQTKDEKCTGKFHIIN